MLITMKKIILVAFLVLLPSLTVAAGMGESAGHNLDELWQQAQANYDLEKEDAVILLESQQVSFSHDGNLQTRIHRVVWIGTAVGIRSYADLRIPWNTATSTLEVEKLRTWMDGRWWPHPEKISDTAVVHTLPYAVDKADDYTTMRETMLLHDGVELGCIMETAYVITEQNVPAGGQVFVFPQQDPAVLTELRLMAPHGMPVRHLAVNRLAAASSLAPTKGSALLWQSHMTPALKQPMTSNPAVDEPAVIWSTWGRWEDLAKHWLSAFQTGTELTAEQTETFQATLHDGMSRQQKLLAVGEYLNEMVRGIHYNDHFWRFAPRPASRTLATAYGHNLDRAVLAAALLDAAGLKAEPMLMGQGQTLVGHDLPRLQGMSRALLLIDGLGHYVLDPADGHLKGFDEVFGHPFWYVAGYGSGPQLHLPQPEKYLMVSVSLSPGQDGAWTGEGAFQGAANFSHYGSLATADDLSTGYLATLLSSVATGAKPQNVVPGQWSDGLVEARFTVEMPALAEDDFDRLVLTVGQPAGGLLANLPHDVHLHDAGRQTRVLGVERWYQEVMIRIEVEKDRILHTPKSARLENAAGTFALEVEYAEGWLTLKRSLKLAEGPFKPALWSDLRALLLAEAASENGTVIFSGE